MGLKRCHKCASPVSWDAAFCSRCGVTQVPVGSRRAEQSSTASSLRGDSADRLELSKAPAAPKFPKPALYALVVFAVLLTGRIVWQNVVKPAFEPAAVGEPPPSLPTTTSTQYSDLPSVLVGGKCIARQMRLQDVATMYARNPMWEFR